MKWHYSSLSSFNLQELIPPLCQNPKMTFKLTCRLSNYKSKLYHILLSGLSKLQTQTEHIRDNNITAFAIACSLSFFPQLLSSVLFFFLQAEKFDGSGQPVVAIKGARLSDFGGRSVSALFSSTVMVNPDTPEAFRLRAW